MLPSSEPPRFEVAAYLLRDMEQAEQTDPELAAQAREPRTFTAHRSQKVRMLLIVTVLAAAILSSTGHWRGSTGCAVLSWNSHILQFLGRKLDGQLEVKATETASEPLEDTSWSGRYQRIAHGSCEARGLRTISDKAACKEAGEEFGYLADQVYSTNLLPVAERCYVFENFGLRRPTMWMGSDDLDEGGFNPICRTQHVALTTTTTVPSAFEAREFLQVLKGNCAYWKLFSVPDEAICGYAALVLGLTSTEVLGKRAPEGCYFVEATDSEPSHLEWYGKTVDGEVDPEFQNLRKSAPICMIHSRGEELTTTPAPVEVQELDNISSTLALPWIGCWSPQVENASTALLGSFGSWPHIVSTEACAKKCSGWAFMALKHNFWCTCENRHPVAMDLRRVRDEECGDLCYGEAKLQPKRYCGSADSFAVYRPPPASSNAPPETTRAPQLSARSKFPARAFILGSSNGFAPIPALRDGVMKGLCYSPVPERSNRDVVLNTELLNDDFMSSSTGALWSEKGRGDLKLIAGLGANAVRLYGNDPTLNHRAFLDEASLQGLQVLPGMSDYIYLKQPGNCYTTDFNCYSQLKSSYAKNLERGFSLVSGGIRSYHPALRTIILMNEPELKFYPVWNVKNTVKAMVTAFDGVLDAEKEAHLQGPAPNFTVTFSFGVCGSCSQFEGLPGLGPMWELRRAMRNPMLVDYTPKNDIWNAYLQRFENSVNTANPAADFKRMFLDRYDLHFQGTALFIGEYHAPFGDGRALQEDVESILHIASDEGNHLRGISFFEFQVRYDKGGAEMSFGMFGLGDQALDDFTIMSNSDSRLFSAWCLVPMHHGFNGKAQVCGAIEDNTLYESNSSWDYDLDMINSPLTCCSLCTMYPSCKSWTFNELTSRCRLHDTATPTKTVKQGITSGLPSAPADTSDLSLPDAVAAAFGAKSLDKQAWPKLCSTSQRAWLSLS